MKAKLLLTIDDINNIDNELAGEEVLVLRLVNYNLNHPLRGSAILYSTSALDDTSKEDFFTKLEEIINIATLWKNSIDGIKIIVDESVCEYLDDPQEENEVKKFISALIIGM